MRRAVDTPTLCAVLMIGSAVIRVFNGVFLRHEQRCPCGGCVMSGIGVAAGIAGLAIPPILETVA